MSLASPAAVPAPSGYQHLQTSSSFTQTQFVYPQAISTCRPTPASPNRSSCTLKLPASADQLQPHPAAVPAPSSYQHLQTSSSFTQKQFLHPQATNFYRPTPASPHRSLYTLKQPAFTDQPQLYPTTVPAPSSYQHLQTCSSFTSSSSCTLEL